MYGAINGREQSCQLLLQHPKIEVNARSTSDNETALIGAVKQGHANIVKQLLNDPRVEVNAHDTEGMTPLMYAVRNGREESCQLLLQHPHIEVNAVDDRGMTALHLAFAYNIEVFASLLNDSRVEPNIMIQNSMKMLDRCVISCSTEGIEKEIALPQLKLLVANDRVNINALDRDGNSALHTAIILNADGISKRYPDIIDSLDSIRILLTHSAVNVNLLSNDLTQQNTPLRLAVQFGNLAVVKILLEHPAINLEIQSLIHSDKYPNDTHAYTALDYARKSNNPEMINLLTTHIASTRSSTMKGK